MDKISGLLSDEESVRQLSELAKMFMSESGEKAPEGESAETSESPDSSDGGGAGGMPDIDTLLKLTSLAGAFTQNDRNTELLMALKPHLGEEKQKKVDKAVKLLRLIAVWNIAKESGLLKDMF